MSHQRSFNCIIQITAIETANTAHESVCFCALGLQGRSVAFSHTVHQTDFICPVLAVAALAMDMHQTSAADPVRAGLGAAGLHQEPATLAPWGSVVHEVLELATTEGLAPLWAQGEEGGRCKRRT